MYKLLIPATSLLLFAGLPRRAILRAAVIFGILFAATAVVLVLVLTASGSTTHVSLKAVPDQVFDDAYLELLQPDPKDQPKLTSEEATAAATQPVVREGPSSKAREVLLARLFSASKAPNGRLVWVIDLEPSTVDFQVIGDGSLRDPDATSASDVEQSVGPVVTTYAVEIIDANTGEFLYYLSSATQDASPAP